jgi:hypothetical protein
MEKRIKRSATNGCLGILFQVWHGWGFSDEGSEAKKKSSNVKAN